MLNMLYNRIKKRQVNFYAFLTKEFNIINYKSARCSMHCFQDPSRPITSVNKCLRVCRQGIEECKDFAYQRQKAAEEELDFCHK